MEGELPQLFFNLPNSDQMKIIGLLFTHNLSWSPHAKNVSAKTKSSIYLLEKARPFLSNKNLCNLYKSHIRSKMEYCRPIWCGAPLDALKQLDRLQDKAIKIIGDTNHGLQSLQHRAGISLSPRGDEYLQGTRE